MSKLVKQNTTDIQVASNTDVGGIYFHCDLAHNTANNHTATIDWKAVQITCTLHRDNQTYTIVSGNAQALLTQAYYSDERYKTINTAVSAHGNQSAILVAKATSVKQRTIVPGTIDFSGTLNLRGRDRLELEVTWNTGSSDVDLATTSSLVCGFTHAVGLELFTPCIKTYSISSGQRDFTSNLGNGIQQITYVDTDNDDELVTNESLSRCKLTSDKLNFNKQMIELRAEVRGDFEGDYARKNNFDLYNGIPLDSCHIELTHDNTANVVAGANFVVVRSAFQHPKAVAFALKKTAKHQRKAVAKARGTLRRSRGRK